MYQYLAFLTIFLAILSSQASAGQTNSKSQAVQTDPSVASNGSGAASGASTKPEVQTNSRQASEDAKRFYKMGVKYGRAGLFRQAAELFQKAIQLKPDYADAYYGLGHAHLDLRRWREAIRSFERALKINPRDKEARAKA